MSSFSVVTGGSAGIGAAFARRLAAEGSDLLLVARDPQRLAATAAELHQRYGVDVQTLVADLATGDGCRPVEAVLADPGRPVDLLVNNAGMGLNTRFLQTSADDQERMLRLNCLAVLRLTHAALSAMVPRGRGDVINVSSVSAFVPGVRGSYGATKAWVTGFSEAVAGQLAGTGVRVSALCPGYTRTEFHQRARLDMSGTPGLLWLRADDVVAAGLRDHRRGKVVSVPGLQYKAIVAATRLLPAGALLRVFSGPATGRRRLPHPGPGAPTASTAPVAPTGSAAPAAATGPSVPAGPSAPTGPAAPAQER